MKWMKEEVRTSGTDKKIATKAVKEFPDHFRGQYKANVQKASRWYKDADSLLAEMDGGNEKLSFSALHLSKVVQGMCVSSFSVKQLSVADENYNSKEYESVAKRRHERAVVPKPPHGSNGSMQN